MVKHWVNGVESDQLSINDRGLSYGDGLFETIAIINGQPHLLFEHLRRLELGLQRLKFPQDTLTAVKSDIASLQFSANQVLKITVTRGLGERGYKLPTSCLPTRILSLSPASDFSTQRQDGVSVRLCEQRLGHNPVLAQIKHLNRLEQVLARSEWENPAIAEGIVCDLDGFVIEGTMSNLFWVVDSQLFTPDLQRCGVQGVMRDRIIDLAMADAIKVNIGSYPSDALANADEVFICNSLIGIWPVTAIDQQCFQIGAVTKKIQKLLSKEIGC